LKSKFSPFKKIKHFSKEESGWCPKLRKLVITYSYIKIDTNHNVEMFQTNVYRGKTLINLEFKNNSGTSTQGHSCSSMSKKSLHSDVEIPQLWENLVGDKMLRNDVGCEIGFFSLLTATCPD